MTTKNNITNINSELPLLIKGSKNDLKTNIQKKEIQKITDKLYDILWKNRDPNSAFLNLASIILTKIYDEKTTLTGAFYRFQIYPWEKKQSSIQEIYNRINTLYNTQSNEDCALKRLLNYKNNEIILIKKINLTPEEIKQIIKLLQHLSLSTNNYNILKTLLKEIQIILTQQVFYHL